MPDGPGLELLDIAEVSARTGLAVSALRFYEEIGLITSTGRRGTRRLFPPAVLQRLALITLCRRSGFTLAEIKDLVRAHARHTQGWRPLVAGKVEELQTRIDEVTAVRDGLQHALGCTAPDILTCPHLQASLEAALPAADSSRTRRYTR